MAPNNTSNNTFVLKQLSRQHSRRWGSNHHFNQLAHKSFFAFCQPWPDQYNVRFVYSTYDTSIHFTRVLTMVTVQLIFGLFLALFITRDLIYCTFNSSIVYAPSWLNGHFPYTHINALLPLSRYHRTCKTPLAILPPQYRAPHAVSHSIVSPWNARHCADNNAHWTNCLTIFIVINDSHFVVTIVMPLTSLHWTTRSLASPQFPYSTAIHLPLVYTTDYYHAENNICLWSLTAYHDKSCPFSTCGQNYFGKS